MKRRRCATLAALVSICCTVAVGQQALATAPDEVELGRAIYTNCAACHGDAGQGGFGPPLAGQPSLADKDYAIAKILAGSPRMPPFGEQLTPREIAMAINWMSQSWGDGSVRVRPAEVSAIAARMKGGVK